MIALHTSSLHKYGLNRIFEFAKKAGYDGIEIMVDKNNFDTQNAEYIKELSDEYKLPVIATRTGGLPDQIQDEQTGLLVEPGSSHDLADAIIRILDDPDFANDLSQSLQNKFVMNDNWENISDQYLETCQRAFSGRNK